MFEAGQSYETRSVCDHDMVIRITVARRTRRTIVTTEGKRLGISIAPDGREWVFPWGRYSMCPAIDGGRAGRRATTYRD